nr:ribonuclease H-like domain-containing protein [Tanacetum cinerariifolium]
MDEPNNPITPRLTTPPTSPPQPDSPPSHSSTSIQPQPDTHLSHSLTPILTSVQTQLHDQTIDNHTPIPINNSSQTTPTHPMVTRAKDGIFKPLKRMNCHVTTTSPLLRSHVHALRDPNWKEAIGSDIACLLLYVDDIILTASSLVFLPRTITSLYGEFAMTNLGSLNYFLGISAQRSASGLFLSQSTFVEEILERAHMQKCNPCRTPVDTESKLGSDGEPVSDPTLYRNLAGALQYLTFIRPDLSYVVQQLHVSSTTHLRAYTDADWAGCLLPVSPHPGITCFLATVFYHGMRNVRLPCLVLVLKLNIEVLANVVAETAWIRNLLCELHTPLFTATLVYCDNVSAVYMSANPVQHQRTKHIEIDIHFVRDFIASRQIHLLHVPSRFQYADIFTKGLPTALFIEFRSSLNVRRSSAHTEREY